MPVVLRNILAVILGAVIGAVVNGVLITLSPSVIPPPDGVDVTQTESIAQNIHLFQPKHFLMPFLAHAVGTLVGAVVAYLAAASSRVNMAYIVGILFLCGGIAACFMIPAPKWFMALDLLVAYIPMAWLGIQIGERIKPSNS